jgi:uncharacterized protein Yka (UPF0111/DUF47 family)
MTETAGVSSELENFLDQRLNQQSEKINSLLLKYPFLSKSDITEIKKNQDFLSDKFDDIAKSIEDLKPENNNLLSKNTELVTRINEREHKVTDIEKGSDDLQSYLHRDLLEFHGVPISEDEKMDEIVLKVTKLIVPKATSQLVITFLPFWAIFQLSIVKFVRRNCKRALREDLGFYDNTRLFVNESLTRKSCELFNKVKAFHRDYHYKFAWMKNGKVLLCRDEAGPVHSFSPMEEFRTFAGDLENITKIS